MRLLTSQLSSPVRAPLVVARGTAEVDAQRVAQGPILFPRYDPRTRTVRMVPTPAHLLPPGWQSTQVHVPMRLATCEETDCPMFLRGWTEIVTADGGSTPRQGAVSQDEAASTFGLYGPREVPPEVVHHPAGTPCPRIHKVPSGVPPLYTLNGRTVLWTEFEDSIGTGLEAVRKHRQHG